MLVGLGGLKGSGKSTVGMWLENRGFTRLSLANKIKEIASDLYGFPIEWFDDRTRKEEPLDGWGVSPRQIAQRIGTEVARSIHVDTWTRYLDRYVAEDGDFVVDDVRFPNEVDWVRSHDGITIYIDRPELARSDNHPSEAMTPDGMDVTVFNDSSIDVLFGYVWSEIQFHKRLREE